MCYSLLCAPFVIVRSMLQGMRYWSPVSVRCIPPVRFFFSVCFPSMLCYSSFVKFLYLLDRGNFLAIAYRQLLQAQVLEQLMHCLSMHRSTFPVQLCPAMPILAFHAKNLAPTVRSPKIAVY
jgi:hypothetical protein